ncbi:uncharacterized protein LOC114165102 [Vigna unguiculata]|uniref:START domain-containing protein n=1 Tax=Vigna unguiculata TaxID=3917 RepID=A0A4D6MLI2_VIGUN|nr:uncharacterized protein LOC114165102 [Vigna unguiculata]QCE02203.1 hypothetical protein DEO72_LG8g214 [Vigna unguiculata]
MNAANTIMTLTTTMSVFTIYAYGVWGLLTSVVLFLVMLFLWQRNRFFFAPSSPSPRSTPSASSFNTDSIISTPRTSNFVTYADLKFLMEILDEKLNENDKWEDVLDRRNHHLCYSVKCFKPKNGPLRYLSKTVFNDISSEMLRNFYMDNDYRKQWDKTVIEHNQLQVDKSDGTEVGHTIKKFPLLTPREYVLAWKLWQGSDKTFYCFMKECEHPLVPRQRKYVRVEFFRSGWQIREVAGSNACEITMFHQEDAGLNMEMAKLAFRKGIWSYVCKMDDALRRYSAINYHLSSSVNTSLNLMQKVPAYLDSVRSNISRAHPTVFDDQVNAESQKQVIQRRPSRKFLANSLLLLGGATALCLSRGHSSLGAKVAIAYVLTKFSKRGARSNQS